MGWESQTRVVSLLIVGAVGAALGCGGRPPPAEVASSQCAERAVEPTLQFASDDEAKRHFAQLEEDSHKARIRHEHALRALRDDKRWAEPEQRIWLSIATTDTLEAIEKNRTREREAKQQLLALAAR